MLAALLYRKSFGRKKTEKVDMEAAGEAPANKRQERKLQKQDSTNLTRPLINAAKAAP